MKQHNIDPHDGAAFVRMIFDLLPEGAKGKILIGSQWPGGAVTPAPFDGDLPDTATHLSSALFEAGADGHWRAATPHVSCTLGLILDDVGNPEKAPETPTLTPTARVWTSEGSEQWLFLYSEPVTPEKGRGMARAAAMAGMSDPFIEERHHHWWRLPGSLPAEKIKQGRTEPARLAEWTGETYGYAELAGGLGIDPEAVPVTEYSGKMEFHEASALMDPLWRWLIENGHTKPSNFRNFDSRGFADVRCPNCDREGFHNDGRPWARYCPPNSASRAAFTCHHGNCDGLGLKDFRQWAEAEGGPSERETKDHARDKITIYDEISVNELAAIRERVASANRPYAPRTEEIAEAEIAKVRGRLESLPWQKRFAEHGGPPEYVLPFYLPRGILTSLYGRDGLGKNTLMMGAAMLLAVGRSAFLQPPQLPRRVMFYGGEDPEHVILDRMARFMEHFEFTPAERELLFRNFDMPDLMLEDLKLFVFGRDYTRTPTAFTEALAERIEAFAPDLLILDPLSDLFEDNENDRAKVAPFLRYLNQVAHEHGISVTLLGHPAKSEDSEYSGSGAWSSKTRSRLLLAEEEGRLTLYQRKNSWGQDAAPLPVFWNASGVLVPELPEAAAFVQETRDRQLQTAILAGIRTLAERGIVASPSPNAASHYLPKLMAAEGLNEGFGQKDIRRVLGQLLDDGIVESGVEFDGREGRPEILQSNRSAKKGLWPSVLS